MTCTNLLRPNQLAQFEDTKLSLEGKLASEHTQDKRTVKAQLNRMERQFDIQRPKEFKSSEIDKSSKECKEILKEVVAGMPSQEEMRKCPPGAVNKHRMWEKENKEKILKWKNLTLRLNVGSEDPDVANLEKYRPVRSTLNMENAMISGQNYSIPETVGISVIFSDDDLAMIKERAPEEIYNKLALLPSDQRNIVRQQFITAWYDETAEQTEEEPAQEPTEETSEANEETVWGNNTSETSGE